MRRDVKQGPAFGYGPEGVKGIGNPTCPLNDLEGFYR